MDIIGERSFVIYEKKLEPSKLIDGLKRQLKPDKPDKKAVGKTMLDILHLVPGFQVPEGIDNNLFKKVTSDKNFPTLRLLANNEGTLDVVMDPIDKRDINIRLVRESGQGKLRTDLTFIFKTSTKKLENVTVSYGPKAEKKKESVKSVVFTKEKEIISWISKFTDPKQDLGTDLEINVMPSI